MHSYRCARRSGAVGPRRCDAQHLPTVARGPRNAPAACADRVRPCGAKGLHVRADDAWPTRQRATERAPRCECTRATDADAPLGRRDRRARRTPRAPAHAARRPIVDTARTPRPSLSPHFEHTRPVPPRPPCSSNTPLRSRRAPRVRRTHRATAAAHPRGVAAPLPRRARAGGRLQRRPPVPRPQRVAAAPTARSASTRPTPGAPWRSPASSSGASGRR